MPDLTIVRESKMMSRKVDDETKYLRKCYKDTW